MAMLGGRRVVRVREAGDALAAAAAAALQAPGDSLIVMEASGALPARSKLRALAEGLEVGAAIACYPEEGRALGERIGATLAAAGISMDADALQYAVERMGSDSAAVGGRSRS